MLNTVKDSLEPARRVDTLTEGTDMVQVFRGWARPDLKRTISQISQETTKEKEVDGIDAAAVNAGAVSIISSTTASTDSSRRSSFEDRAPARLTRFTPPENFGTVIDGKIFRSSYPKPENFGYLKSLKLKSILTLVSEDIPEEFASFMAENGIRHIRVHVPANKEVVRIKSETMVQALTVVLDRSNYPLLIHCNKGKHRTGCVVACLGKVLGKDLDEIKEEYHTYADPKARVLDEQFMEQFDERSVLWLARHQGFLPDDEPRSPLLSLAQSPRQPA